MKTYIIYFDAPLLSGDKHQIYIGENGAYTTQVERAKKFDINNALTLLILILKLILKLKKNLKYKVYEK